MIRFDDFKNEAGKIDWSAYYRAQVEAGERCTQCGGLIVFGNTPHSRCGDCKAIDEPDELRHSSHIRCPKCGHAWSVAEYEDGYLYQEGSNDLDCIQCGHEFAVESQVSWTFVSPPLEGKPDEEE